MTRTGPRLRLAARFGYAGGTVGVAAGAVQATLGSRIPSWTGDKDNPVVLGLVTVVLSLGAVAAARALHSADHLTAGRRAAAAVGLVVPAGLCSTTAGHLWILPGLLLLLGVGLTLSAGGLTELLAVVAAHATRGLVSLLGICEVLMAAVARPAAISIVGVIAGLALTIAPWLLSRGGGMPTPALLLLGAVPFAVLTWWTLATPLLGSVVLILGSVLLRSARVRRPASGSPAARPRPRGAPA